MRRWLREVLWAVLEGMRFYPCTVRRGWWRRPPFLPLPSRRYLKFRLDTAYGEVAHGWRRPGLAKTIRDVKSFLLWRREFRRGR